MIRGLLKKSIFIIITFMAVSFICSIQATMTASFIASGEENNEYLTEDSLQLYFENVQGLSKEDLQQFSKINKDILLYKEDAIPIINGVFCSGKKTPKVPLIEGRYFKDEDFKSDKKLAVVGKKKFEECIAKDGKKYYKDEENEYEIIGVMGYEHKATDLDWKIHYSMSGIYSIKKPWAREGTYTLDCGKSTKDTAKKIKQYIEDKFLNAKVEITRKEGIVPKSESLTQVILGDSITVIILIICISLNTVSLTSDWIDSRIKELAIKKAFGATDKIIGRILKTEYIIMVTVAFLLGFLISAVGIKLGMLGDIGRDIYWIATVISYLICLSIGFITVRIPINKAKKVQVSEIMR